MAARASFYLLILLVMILISLQNPLPVVNPNVSLRKYSDQPTSKFREKESTIHITKSKREASGESTGNRPGDLPVPDNSKTQLKEVKDRTKRLESEDSNGLERDQFYKPLSDETKEPNSIIRFNKDTEVKPDHKLTNDISSLTNVVVPKPARPLRQAGDSEENTDLRRAGDSEKNTDLRFESAKGLKDKGQILDELSGNFGNVEGTRNAQRKEREDYDIQEMTDSRHFNSEAALEAMRKINPLTIGKQVSQMIHDRKCKNKPMSKVAFGSNSPPLHHEDKAGFLQDNEDMAKVHGTCNKHQPSACAQKLSPSSNDYGFSVIILAGDPIKGAPEGNEDKNVNPEQEGKGCNRKLFGKQRFHKSEMDGKGLMNFNSKYQNDETRIENNPNTHEIATEKNLDNLNNYDSKYKNSKMGIEKNSNYYNSKLKKSEMRSEKNPDIYNSKYENNKLLIRKNPNTYNSKYDKNEVLSEKNPNTYNSKYENSETRIEKNPNVNAEFPVYDQDLTDNPDPFNGLLEQNYWVGSANREDKRLLQGSTQGAARHRIYVRSALRKSSKSSGRDSLFKKGKKSAASSGKGKSINVGTDEVTSTVMPDIKIDDTSGKGSKDDKKLDEDSKKSDEASKYNKKTENGSKDNQKDVDTNVKNVNKADGGLKESKKSDNDSEDDQKSANGSKDSQKDVDTNVNNVDKGDGGSKGRRKPEKPSKKQRVFEEPFADLEVNKNESCCISWNDMTVFCDTQETTIAPTTTVVNETTPDQCGGGGLSELEPFGDMKISNNTCCNSYKQLDKNNTTTG